VVTSALIPPPRANAHSYFGVLAPNARMRALVVASARPPAKLEILLDDAARKMGLDDRPRSAWSRMYAMLMARILEVYPLVCRKCGSEMKIIAFITDAPTIHHILTHLELDPDPPVHAPARAPPHTTPFPMARSPFDPMPACEDIDQSADESWDQTLDAPRYDD